MVSWEGSGGGSIKYRRGGGEVPHVIMYDDSLHFRSEQHEVLSFESIHNKRNTEEVV